MLTQFNEKNEELEDQSKETNQQIKHLSNDYFNLISKALTSNEMLIAERERVFC